MTIVFQGHIVKTEASGPTGLNVHVVTPMQECGQTVVLHVPASDAAHWLAGSPVSFTIYALPNATKPVGTPS